jgi:protein-S-isoprenylcysteine O-methyltransferase Ste14
MKNELFIALVILCIITHIVRTVYEILKHKQAIKPDRMSFIIVFADMLLLWASWFGLCLLDTGLLRFPFVIRYSGIAMVVLGVVFFLTGLYTIKSLESYEGDLITQGIYSKIRHPMYLGFILWLVGMPLYSGGLLSFVLCVLFISNILFWRYLEEKELEKRFPEYTDYRKKTIF